MGSSHMVSSYRVAFVPTRVTVSLDGDAITMTKTPPRTSAIISILRMWASCFADAPLFNNLGGFEQNVCEPAHTTLIIFRRFWCERGGGDSLNPALASHPASVLKRPCASVAISMPITGKRHRAGPFQWICTCTVHASASKEQVTLCGLLAISALI